MSEFKVSTFIIGVIFASLLATVFGLVMSEFSSNYGVTYTENESIGMEIQFKEITNLTTDIENEATAEKKEKEGNWFTDTADFLGDLFNDGYKSLKITWKSLGIFRTMTTEGLDKVGMGAVSPLIKGAIISSIIIIIIVGVVISALVRKNV